MQLYASARAVPRETIGISAKMYSAHADLEQAALKAVVEVALLFNTIVDTVNQTDSSTSAAVTPMGLGLGLGLG